MEWNSHKTLLRERMILKNLRNEKAFSTLNKKKYEEYNMLHIFTLIIMKRKALYLCYLLLTAAKETKEKK